jgi:hypothetical protein
MMLPPLAFPASRMSPFSLWGYGGLGAPQLVHVAAAMLASALAPPGPEWPGGCARRVGIATPLGITYRLSSDAPFFPLAMLALLGRFSVPAVRADNACSIGRG